MKFGYEEILMVVIAFLIGWFLKTMMSGRLIEGGGGVSKLDYIPCDDVSDCPQGRGYCDRTQPSYMEGRCTTL
jgi:hypothetical protein